MTTREACIALDRAGGRVVWADGKPEIVGKAIPKNIIEVIRADKDAFLDDWASYWQHRFDVVPPSDLRMRVVPPAWRNDVYRRIERYVRTQSDPVTRWVFDRACAYTDKGMPNEPALKSAMLDLLMWQVGNRFKDPVATLMALEYS